MSEIVIISIIALYLLIGVGHAVALFQYAGKNYARPTPAQVSLVALASFFWPITWLWYGVDRLRGRVA